MHLSTASLFIVRMSLIATVFVVSTACETRNGDPVEDDRGEWGSDELDPIAPLKETLEAGTKLHFAEDANSNAYRSFPIEDPFETLVHGDNTCYMIEAYFPKDVLVDILPSRLSIPDDETMEQYFPDTTLKGDEHPLLIYFCHCSGIHDIQTNIMFPEQEEMLFLIPVMYEHTDGEKHLCSYVPVLYLDSLQGVLGGLIFRLRKEFHPEMEKNEATDSAGWWRMGDIIEGTFESNPNDPIIELPHFFAQMFDNPYVTLSYPLPFLRYGFYKVEVSQDTTRLADGSFYWNYKGATVQDDDDTLIVYSDYHFTMSWPMNADQYFQ